MRILLSEKDIDRLKAFIISCYANPDILYLPQLRFFKEYLESLGAKIPAFSGKSRNKDSTTSGLIDAYPASPTDQTELDVSSENDFHPNVNSSKQIPTASSSISSQTNESIFGIVASANENDVLDINGANGQGDESDSDHEMTECSVEGKRDGKFVCSTCGQSFSSNKDLSKHSEIHKKENESDKLPPKCIQCDIYFESKNLLLKHLRNDHVVIGENGEKRYVCTQCGKTFSSNNDLNRHFRIHTGEKPYQCTECKKSFSRKRNYRDHVRIHTGEKPYICNQCQLTFISHNALRFHVKRIHIEEKPFKCNLCEAGFITELNLTRHISKMHTGERPYKCEHCEKSFPDKYSLKNHTKIHRSQDLENPYKCTKCGNLFITSGELSKHINIHTECIEDSFHPSLKLSCTIPSSGSSSSCSFNKIKLGNFDSLNKTDELTLNTGIENDHGKDIDKEITEYSTVDNEEGKILCSWCGHSFSSKEELTKHLEIHKGVIESGELTIRCIQCKIVFGSRTLLSRHMMSKHIVIGDNGEKKFMCAQCGKSCSSNQDLTRHFMIHTGEKPYQCTQCDKSFSRKHHYKNHVRIHTGEKPFLCSQCAQCFTSDSALKMHVRMIHIGIKSFKCNICEEAFFSNLLLTRHMSKIHTGNPFKCDHCNKSFSDKHRLKDHIKIHNKDAVISIK